MADLKKDEEIVDYFNNLILNEFKDFTCWVCGGAILSYIDNRRINDIDVFFKNNDERKKCINYLIDNGGIVSSDNDNTSRVLYKNKTIDVIKHYYQTPQECADSMDFSVCGISTDGKDVYKTKNFYNDWRKKILVFDKQHDFNNPIVNVLRMQKYLMRGYRMNVDETLKLIHKLRLRTEEEIIDAISHIPPQV